MPSPIAHLTVGYVLCRALRSAADSHPRLRQLQPTALLLPACLFFALLPDSDSALGILFGSFGNFHNQWSHSLFFWIPPALLLASGVWMLTRNSAQALAWGLLCLTSCVMHVLMDYTCQGRGVMLFWPFTAHRFIAPALLFYGVRWSDGAWSLRHIPTAINEGLFALLLLPPAIYLTRRTARPMNNHETAILLALFILLPIPAMLRAETNLADVARAQSLETLSPQSAIPTETNEPRRTSLLLMTGGFIGVQYGAVLLNRNNDDWTDEGHRFRDGFTLMPTRDDDTALYNYVLHPWVGSEYYLAARNRGLSFISSLAYSAALSAYYEFFAENLIQQPSGNDLLITPLAGTLLGEARFALKQKIRENPTPIPGAAAWIALLDPVDISIGGYPDGQLRLYLNWKHDF